jgi:hypothetical protein
MGEMRQLLHESIPSAHFGIEVEENAAGLRGCLSTSVNYHKSGEESHRMLFAAVWSRRQSGGAHCLEIYG